MIIRIHCSHCEGVFDFEHPSVQRARDVMGVTVTCSWCGTILKAPDDEVHMIPIFEYQDRQLRRMGIEPDPHRHHGYVELVTAESPLGDE